MLGKTWKFISAHPLTKRNRGAALCRYLSYQLVTRIRTHSTRNWFAGAKLSVSKDMRGASGNIYCGLHEPADMGFILHFLRPGDLFLDIGANVGTYTIIASKICGATTIAFEPNPKSAERLRRNVALNEIADLVTVAEMALMDREGEVQFSIGLDAGNHVLSSGKGQLVKCSRLDQYLGGRQPAAMKLDVEGAEASVFLGASNTLASPALLAIETETSDPAIVAQLRAAGFERAYYDPWSRVVSRDPVGTSAVNSLFVRELETVQQRVLLAPQYEVLPGEKL